MGVVYRLTFMASAKSGIRVYHRGHVFNKEGTGGAQRRTGDIVEAMHRPPCLMCGLGMHTFAPE